MPIGLVLLPVLLVLTALFLGFLAFVGYEFVAGVAAITHRPHAHVRRG